MCVCICVYMYTVHFTVKHIFYNEHPNTCIITYIYIYIYIYIYYKAHMYTQTSKYVCVTLIMDTNNES